MKHRCHQMNEICDHDSGQALKDYPELKSRIADFRVSLPGERALWSGTLWIEVPRIECGHCEHLLKINFCPFCGQDLRDTSTSTQK
jgi:hypothetical protein